MIGTLLCTAVAVDAANKKMIIAVKQANARVKDIKHNLNYRSFVFVNSRYGQKYESFCSKVRSSFTRHVISSVFFSLSISASRFLCFSHLFHELIYIIDVYLHFFFSYLFFICISINVMIWKLQRIRFSYFFWGKRCSRRAEVSFFLSFYILSIIWKLLRWKMMYIFKETM